MPDVQQESRQVVAERLQHVESNIDRYYNQGWVQMFQALHVRLVANQ
ncbi:hypothetical protein VCSRO12_2239 [Vibrio cholerae]|nr:hypothetical protein VCSRO62_0150 [Vibrio cholerae]GHY08214.1 hypothetical protein VCSRO112_1884 [Vibrio cholerae]GHY65810.1 hypothetical protein VCSRO12_2239 [Vibrio cholerae]GHY76157.1 hypothetical protein VCSRO74_2478 [Vibrio cholerae]GHZ60439.1 hypothetical protein VCSRO80_2362 [Vibrio cholerae]